MCEREIYILKAPLTLLRYSEYIYMCIIYLYLFSRVLKYCCKVIKNYNIIIYSYFTRVFKRLLNKNPLSFLKYIKILSCLWKSNMIKICVKSRFYNELS